MPEIKRPAQGGNFSGGSGRRPAGTYAGTAAVEDQIAPFVRNRGSASKPVAGQRASVEYDAGTPPRVRTR